MNALAELPAGLAKRARRCRCLRAIATAALVVALGLAVAQESVVAEFRGSGGSNTRPFEVSAGWEIQWDASGDIFQLYLHDMNGDLVGVPANPSGPGQGASYQAEPGTYYLQVNAIGNWTLRVVQVASDASPAAGDATARGVEFSGNGGRNTRPFQTNGPWELQWNASGDIFQIYLHAADGQLVDVAANQSGSGSGSSFQPRAGEYYLQVNALGAWSIRVVPVDEP